MILKDMLDSLVKARELVARGWTTCVLARSKTGTPVDFADGRAVSFCMEGALRRATLGIKLLPNEEYEINDVFLAATDQLLVAAAVRDICIVDGLSSYNDATGRTKEDVLSIFDGAISSIEEELKCNAK